MARYRTLDADLWKHRDIRRAPLRVGWLYAYLITAEADDEGRFVADAWTLAEDCFSSAHGVGEEEVEAGLRFLDECGLVLLYDADDIRYGFLTGWYEHQYIQRDRRASSALPPPPCPVASWQEADEVRQECADERGFDIRKITYQESLRWNQQRGYQVDNERVTGRQLKGHIGLQIGNHRITNGYPEGEVEGEGEGEGKNDSLSGASDEAPPPEPSKEDQLRDLRDGIPTEDLSLIDEYLDNAASENTTGRISLGRRVNETRDLLELRSDLGKGPWRYGMAAANRAGAPNANYVKKAAGSWADESGGERKYNSPQQPDVPEETVRGWDNVLGGAAQ